MWVSLSLNPRAFSPEAVVDAINERKAEKQGTFQARVATDFWF